MLGYAQSRLINTSYTFTIKTTKMSSFSIIIYGTVNNAATLNWGDGTSTTVGTSTSAKLHSYTITGEKTITIVGTGLNTITTLNCANQLVTYVEFSEQLTNLQIVQVNSNTIPSLVFHNTMRNIKQVYAYSNTAMTKVIMPYDTLQISGEGFDFSATNIKSFITPKGIKTVGCFKFNAISTLQTLDLSDIEYVISNARGALTTQNCTSLTNFVADKLIANKNILRLDGCSLLQTISLPEFVENTDINGNGRDIYISSNPLLETFYTPKFEKNIGTLYASNTKLSYLSLNILRCNDLQLSPNLYLSGISFPYLNASVGPNGIRIFDLPLTSVDFSTLTRCVVFNAANLDNITSISLPVLSAVTSLITISNSSSIQSISLPALISGATMSLYDNPQLTSIYTPILTNLTNFTVYSTAVNSLNISQIQTGVNINVKDCNLTQAEVDQFIYDIEPITAYSNNGSLNISGNNDYPSAAGYAKIAEIEAATDWVVLT